MVSRFLFLSSSGSEAVSSLLTVPNDDDSEILSVILFIANVECLRSTEFGHHWFHVARVHDHWGTGKPSSPLRVRVTSSSWLHVSVRLAWNFNAHFDRTRDDQCVQGKA